MQNKDKEQMRNRQTYINKDNRLLALQKELTKKIARTKDEDLIKFYLQQTKDIAQQRLSLLNGVSL